jgi:magnesium-protoporphyrin O-methyltransferase
MSCEQCQALDHLFGDRLARRELRRFRKKGATGATRALLDAITAEGIADATVLDVGGGIGAIPHELLAGGAARAVDVDASGEYLAAAREEAGRRGTGDRFTLVHGDFVELAAEIEPADVVTLDKVICCYPDLEALVRLSAERSLRLYGLVFPRETLAVRAWRLGVNAFMLLRRSAFRFFLHRSADVDRILRERGFEERFRRTSGIAWQVAVYRRRRELGSR